MALKKQDTTALHILGKAGADFNTYADSDGHTLLTYATGTKQSAILPTLLQYSSPDHLDKQGFAPLHYASDKDGMLARMLLTAGANPNITDKNGNTPLHAQNNPRVIAALYEHGADLNQQNACGVPPMGYLVAEGNYAAYQYLVGKGANLNWKDEYGNSVLFYAALEKENALAPYIEKSFLERHPDEWQQFKKDAAKTAIGAAVASIASTKAAQAAAQKALSIFIKKKGLKRVASGFVPIFGWGYTLLTLRKTIREAKALYQQYQTEIERERQLKKELEEIRQQLRKQHLLCA